MSQRITNWKAFKSFLIGALCAPFAAPGELPQIPSGLRDLTPQQRLEAPADPEDARRAPTRRGEA